MEAVVEDAVNAMKLQIMKRHSERFMHLLQRLLHGRVLKELFVTKHLQLRIADPPLFHHRPFGIDAPQPHRLCLIKTVEAHAEKWLLLFIIDLKMLTEIMSKAAAEVSLQPIRASLYCFTIPGIASAGTFEL